MFQKAKLHKILYYKSFIQRLAKKRNRKSIKRYLTDLSQKRWEIIEDLLSETGSRAIMLNAILYVNRGRYSVALVAAGLPASIIEGAWLFPPLDGKRHLDAHPYCITTESDYRHHMDNIAMNPVKHALVHVYGIGRILLITAMSTTGFAIPSHRIFYNADFSTICTRWVTPHTRV